MNLALWLERAGRSHPDASAIGYGTRTIHDYAALAMRAAKIAGALRAAGINAGDRVAIAAKNNPDYLALMFGIWHAGAAAVPANAKLHGSELGYILEHSGARICFASKDIEGEIAPHAPASLQRLIVIGSRGYEQFLTADPVAPAPREDGDLAWLFYTSGTTGKPKGAMLTHNVLSWMSHAYASDVDPVEPGDAIVHAAPLSHGSGLYAVPHVGRLGVNVIPESGGFEASEIFELFGHWRRPSMFAAPTMIKRLVESDAACDARNIRTLIWGGAPMYVEDALKAIERFGPRLAQIYGQGESPMTITYLSKQEIAAKDHPRWLERLGSAGRPYACIEVKVADENDAALPVGTPGEILCRGGAVMPAYWNNPEATAQTLKGGWLHTGDVGVFDEEGYLTLKDRSKDLIISGGSNIYPREVEEVLLQHDRVREVSVIGRPDQEWGEVVIAYVVGEIKAAELDKLCLERIARFKRPKDYVFVDALPKNNYGKILKTELRALDSSRREKQHG